MVGNNNFFRRIRWLNEIGGSSCSIKFIIRKDGNVVIWLNMLKH
jgi:hypothetical protein